MSPVLHELQTLRLSQPSPHASRGEVAAWYERKADVLDHLGEGTTGRDASGLQVQALTARLHAAELRSGVAA